MKTNVAEMMIAPSLLASKQSCLGQEAERAERQEFMPECLPKIQQAAVWRREKNLSYRISVDGGINEQTAAECARVGADTFVSGTSLFGAPSLESAIKKMRQIVNDNSVALAA